jgi:site-specific DNA-methyltransferase (adenine-specific)
MDIENKLINDDCINILRKLGDKSVDCILTDVPYGIDMDRGHGNGGLVPSRQYKERWDYRLSKEYFDEMLRVSKKIFIFGANYYTDYLPQNNHWIVWDKIGEIDRKNFIASDCELIYTNIKDKNYVKKYFVLQNGFLSEEKERFHPTQKPIKLLKRIILDYTDKNELILDCFMGSGSTIIASIETGRRYCGIEKNSYYFEIALKRIKDRLGLFINL